MRRGCGGGSVWSTPWRNVLPAHPLYPETLQPPWRAVSCQECCVEGLFAGGHTCVCAQSMCVRGTGQKQERSDHTCSPAWAAHTGAPPSLGTSSPPPAGSTSLSGLKKAGVWPRGSGRRQQCVRDGNSQPAQLRVVLKGEQASSDDRESSRLRIHGEAQRLRFQKATL